MFRYFKTSPEVIRLAILKYVRCPLRVLSKGVHRLALGQAGLGKGMPRPGAV